MGGNLTFLRIARAMKLVKLLRVIRLMRMFRELRFITNSLMGCFKGMFWSLVLIIAIMYMFGLCFVQTTTSFLVDNEVPEEVLRDMDKFWGSMGSAMTSLYMSSTGGISWIEVAECLKAVGPYVYLLFFIYIAFFLFAATNMITSLFIESGLRIADQDAAGIIQEELDKHDFYLHQLRNWFKKLDTDDDSDEITYGAFCAHMQDQEMLAFARSLDIELVDLKQFFSILSANGKRTVDLETFIVGCIKMRGYAKSMDLQELMLSHKKAVAQQFKIEVMCNQQMRLLQRLCSRTSRNKELL